MKQVRGICVEPMRKNIELLEVCMAQMGFIGPVQVIKAAVSSVSGKALFPDAKMSFEAMGLDSFDSRFPKKTEVNVITLDDIVQKSGFRSVDYLSIDTEGNDVRVVLGGMRILAAQRVRYLEFEYHRVGRWAKSDLQDLTDLLDQLGFDCFWTLNSGALSRLTGCWHDSYYERTWSNVACLHRKDKRTLQAMQTAAGL